jgi:hypothetical protein
LLGSVLYELSKGLVPYATLKDRDVVRLYSVKKFLLVGNLPIGKIIVLSKGLVPYATLKDRDVVRLYSVKKFLLVGNLPMGKIIVNCWNESY